MKPHVLHINIPVPCGQVFEEMSVSGEGRFCGKCHNTVYDFSEMTDAELYRFFENSPAGTCGRFHNDQLHRDIKPVVIRKNIYQRTAKIAASIIAVLTLRNTAVHAQKTPVQPVAQNPVTGNRSLPAITDPLIIKGTVKNNNDYNPLSNVLINFDGIKETRTDKNGNYILELTGIDKSHNIYFSCPNYVPTVRTFNPVMGSTNFDILMGERDSDAIVYSMGIPPPLPWIENKGIPADFPALTFIGTDVVLNEDHKALLQVIANKLKAYIDATIILKAFPLMHGNTRIPLKRMQAMKNYLVEEAGISEGRIAIDMESKAGKSNTVEVIGQ